MTRPITARANSSFISSVPSMLRLYLFLASMAYCSTVETATICDSSYCVCRYDVNSDRDINSRILDCSYDDRVLERQYSLPDNTYLLDLSRNNITIVVESTLLRCDSVTDLILSENKVTSIQSNAFRLPQLRRLDLSYNKLEVLPKDIFKYVDKLEYLNLGNNRFTTIEDLTFHRLTQLQEIILDGNNLGPSLESKNLFDRNGYGIANKIESLSLSGINLNAVHDNFFVDAYNLKKLIISNNYLTDIFELPFTLQYLDLSNNPIEKIAGEDFGDLVALKELKLNNLWITEIEPYTFASLHSLTNLELERNGNLTTFSETAFGHEVLEDADDFALERLSLRSSRLQTLDEKLLEPLGQLAYLDLQGNLWRCDCHLVWLKKLQIPKEDNEHLRCFIPRPVFNTKIFDLDPKYFVCGVKSKGVGIAIAVVSTCLTLTAIAFWIYAVPKYSSRCNFMSNLQIPTAQYTVLPVHANLANSMRN